MFVARHTRNRGFTMESRWIYESTIVMRVLPGLDPGAHGGIDPAAATLLRCHLGATRRGVADATSRRVVDPAEPRGALRVNAEVGATGPAALAATVRRTSACIGPAVGAGRRCLRRLSSQDTQSEGKGHAGHRD